MQTDHSQPFLLLSDFGTWKRPLRPGMNVEKLTTKHRVFHVCTVHVDFLEEGTVVYVLPVVCPQTHLKSSGRG